MASGNKLEIRFGHGLDVHAFAPERRLVLCGVAVPFEKGLDGHSDADVAVHALMDAVLGALALGDIGKHFPDTDDRYLGIDSMKLLKKVMDMAGKAGYAPGNFDITIIAQRPKLAPFIGEMRRNIASACRMPEDAVSVKATTTEHLGFAGRGEGIAALATVTMLAAE